MAEYAIYDGAAHPVVARLPDGWDSSWISPPAHDEASVNGKTDICGLVCNVLNTSLNPFSCIAEGAYTVNVYDRVNGALISTQDVATGVQANWQIDYALCTHQLNTDTRQAWVEIVPRSGRTLTSLRFNTNHPTETNANSSPNFVGVVGVLPKLINATNMFISCYALQSVNLLNLSALTNATAMFQSCYSLQLVNLTGLPVLTTASNMFWNCYALQSVTLPSLPNLASAAYMFYFCYSLQSVNLPNLPSLATTIGMFGSTVESTCLRSLRKLVIPDITVGFVLQYGAMQAQELNALFTSLGTASGAQTIDVRNNPGSATCNTSIATAKGYTILTA